jgi:hypothetical protein
MARGGFLASGDALMRLARVIGDLREASRLLTGAMVSGAISARGRPFIERDVDESGPLVLRDLGSGTSPPLGEVKDIPSSFWKNADAAEQTSWNFEQGFAVSSDRHSAAPAYGDIKLCEKEVNAFVALNRNRLAGPNRETAKPKERRRDPSWDEWVAALATLAHEHAITPELRRTDLLDLIDSRLDKWDLGAKERSTVGPTARKVLERFRTNPPGYPVGNGGEKSGKP